MAFSIWFIAFGFIGSDVLYTILDIILIYSMAFHDEVPRWHWCRPWQSPKFEIHLYYCIRLISESPTYLTTSHVPGTWTHIPTHPCTCINLTIATPTLQLTSYHGLCSPRAVSCRLESSDPCDRPLVVSGTKSIRAVKTLLSLLILVNKRIKNK